MSDKEKMPRVGPPRFSETIAEMSEGDIDRDISDQLRQVVQACEATGKKGKVVITVDVVPGQKLVGVAVTTKTTIPRPALQSSHFFTDERGGLHTENPRQQKMPFDGPRSILPDNKPEN